jgi:lysozyme
MGPRCLLALTAVAFLAVGCGESTPPDAAPVPTPAATLTPTPTPTPTPAPTPTPTPTAEPALLLGIDASHHQGPIDWPRVADAGVTFAYLKASEGTGFVDPRFAEQRRAAARAGIDVAGYHYFQLCTDGTAQAEHFLDVLGPAGTGALPPALDLELAGSCTEPPPRAELLAEVREFLDVVDEATGVPTLVYLYPDLEERFGFAPDLADHPQWVRRLGDRPPRRDWSVWQYDDAGTLPGVGGDVDLNRMKESLGSPGR